MSLGDDIKLFGMHNLMLETDLKKLEESGVQIEHTKTIQRDEIVDVELFEGDILHEARKMADFYALYYSLENSIRRLIAERLFEKYGTNWWKERVPQGVQQEVEKKQREEKDTTMSIRSENPLTYTNFGELISIFDQNWSEFSDTSPKSKIIVGFCARAVMFVSTSVQNSSCSSPVTSSPAGRNTVRMELQRRPLDCEQANSAFFRAFPLCGLQQGLALLLMALGEAPFTVLGCAQQ